jgi:hypothetical protein
MDRKHLISSLQSSAVDDHERTPFCPDDHDIAAFVDGALDDSARILIDRHLPDCTACVSRVGLLTRLMRDDVADAAAAQHTNKKWLAAPQWAVAASILVAVIWLGWSPQTDQPVDYQDARGTPSVLSPPEILAPDSGVLAKREGFVIRWTEVPGSLYYEIRVVSDAGDLLGEERVDRTEWVLPEAIILEPGHEYFVRVDAYLSDSKAISSQHIPFRLRD